MKKKKVRGKKKKSVKKPINPKDKSIKNIKIMVWILAIAILLLIIYVIFQPAIHGWYKKITTKEFQYHNLTFVKTKFGSLDIYRTNLIIQKTDGKFYNFPLAFSNDPRELEYINSTIKIKPKKDLFISFTPEILKCNDTTMAAWKLGEFFGALQFNVAGAVTNESVLKNNSKTQVKTCGHSYDDTSVIVLQETDTNSSESSIHMHEIYIKCYIVEIKNCEIVEASERLILNMMDIIRGYVPEESESNSLK